MIRCLDEIAEQVRRSLNLSLTAAQIENVLRGREKNGCAFWRWMQRRSPTVC